MIVRSQRLFSALVLLALLSVLGLPAKSEAKTLREQCTFTLNALSAKTEKIVHDSYTSLLRSILDRRYHVTIRNVDTLRQGFGEIKDRGTTGIVFVFEHPAFVDPAITYAHFGEDFRPRPLVIENMFKLFGWAMKRIKALSIPIVGKHANAAQLVNAVTDEVAAGINRGENFMLSISGEVKSGNKEDIVNQAILDQIVKKNPNARVVLLRSNGIYGSMFSTGKTGDHPEFVNQIYNFINEKTVTAAILGEPKRPVDIEVKEAFDLPKSGTRTQINTYVSNFMNDGFKYNLHVPLERGQSPIVASEVHAPKTFHVVDVEKQQELLRTTPEHIKKVVLAAVSSVAKQTITDPQTTIDAAGLDSLMLAEVAITIENELGIQIDAMSAPRTIADIMVEANRGLLVKEGKLEKTIAPIDLIRVSPLWGLADQTAGQPFIPSGSDLLDVFYARARMNPDQVAIVDATSGTKTYRDLIAGMSLLSPLIQKFPGKRIGISMPTGVGALTFWLAAHKARKSPAQVNYSQKDPLLQKQGLDSVEVEKVLTARAFTERLNEIGLPPSAILDKLINVEDVTENLPLSAKLRAAANAAFSPGWRTNPLERRPEHAAILFTSGTTGTPKAVGLTSNNILANIRASFEKFDFNNKDKFVALLPEFHAFGKIAVLTALLSGRPTLAFPNPSDFRAIASGIEAYKGTIIFLTPTLGAGLAHSSKPGQLDSIRYVMTGSEKMEESQRQAIQKAMPHAVIVEGYGVTEGSPIVAINPPKAPIPDTLGEVLKNVDYAIVDPDTLEPVEFGKPGMLYIRGESVFSGYLNVKESPFATLKIPRKEPSFLRFFSDRYLYHDDWYKSGDIVQEISPRLLKILHRLDDVRKMGAEKVSLPEIQEKLAPYFDDHSDQNLSFFDAEHPKVDGPQFLVQSADDNMPIVVFTTKTFGTNLVETTKLLRQKQIDLKMSPNSLIAEVRWIPSIPMLGSGKADRKALRKALQEEAVAGNMGQPLEVQPGAQIGEPLKVESIESHPLSENTQVVLHVLEETVSTLFHVNGEGRPTFAAAQADDHSPVVIFTTKNDVPAHRLLTEVTARLKDFPRDKAVTQIRIVNELPLEPDGRPDRSALAHQLRLEKARGLAFER